MESLHFLNLQYWYCLFYSFFGDGCAFMRAEKIIRENSDDNFFGDAGMSFGEFFSTFFGTIADFFLMLWAWFSALMFGISFLLFLLILISLGGLILIRLREREMYSTLVPRPVEDNPRRTTWEALLEDAKSTDPKKWRHAIIEADAMLGELLSSLGYPGVNTGERIQRLPEDAFVTVPVAWEAHRVKNFVVAGSSDFILTQREAFRVMKLYEQVFEEFTYL